ncbi:platelet-activating factor receptor-like [Ostrea edulis]|uniref:platelet-activating factor receptor-like n=1 Tax=Ostrea edulis TaxID=37623 RepID=UPI0024AF925B|nr:platelet-activating factor receptor-like [Ostrea edulis]
MIDAGVRWRTESMDEIKMAEPGPYVANFNIRRWTVNKDDFTNGSSDVWDKILNLDEEFDSFVLHPWAWVEADLTVPFYVYLVPILALLTFCSNTLMIVVFVREKMLSSINIIMIAIGISDTLHVFLPSPFLLALYFSDVSPFIPNRYCRLWDYLAKYIPEITHTASIWLTVFLSLHRYVGVRYPFYIRQISTRRKSVICVITVYCCSSMLHLCRFVDTTYVDFHVVQENKDIFTCKAVHSDWIKGYEVRYECIYYWTCIVLIKVLPLAIVVTLDFLMARELLRADNKRQRFLSDNQSSKESRRVTWIVITVAAIFSLVEIPITIILILWTLSMVHDKMYVSEVQLGELSVVFNIIIYISFPCILFLYCLMSKKFRKYLPCRTSKITSVKIFQKAHPHNMETEC